MKHYRVTADFRNRAGKSLLHRAPLWTGPADDARAALTACEDTVRALLKPDTDTVVLKVENISDPMDNCMTTEYAEDYERGGASSLDRSTLLGDTMEEMTDAQRECAEEELRQIAVAAMPEVAEQLDTKEVGPAGAGTFPGDRREDNGGDDAGVHGGQQGSAAGAAQAQRDAAAGDTAGDSVRPGGHHAGAGGGPGNEPPCVDRPEVPARGEHPPTRGMCPFDFGSRKCGVSPSLRKPHCNKSFRDCAKPERFGGLGGAYQGPVIEERIYEAIYEYEALSGLRPTGLTLSRCSHDDLLRAVIGKGSLNLNASEYMGLPITIIGNAPGPHISVTGPVPRTRMIHFSTPSTEDSFYDKTQPGAERFRRYYRAANRS